jgi:TonB family protein
MKNMTKYLRIFITTTGLMTFLVGSALAGNVKIIANPSVKTDSISAAELKSVFLEESSSLSDGSHVEPVISKGGAAHAAFVKDYLGKTDSDLQTYYRSLVFTGKGSMPKTVGSDAEIAAYVAKTRGAIGYVSVDTNADGVKTLSISGAENDGSRRLITRVDPIYPPALKSNHIGGVVRLKVTITANGSVESASLLGGNPILGESAITAVEKWVYAAGSSKTKTEVSIPFDPGH